jgi:hypothetical protein
MNWKVLKLLGVRGGHCTTSRQVAVSTHDGFIAIFHSLNLSGRTGVDSVSNRNEYEGCLLGIKRPVRRAHNLAAFICQFSGKSGNLILLGP